MAIFRRRASAPASNGNYSKFRCFVREDFSECCAYCLMHELVANGEENFELDHFRPRSLFPELINDYFNLYYACHVCNHTKRDFWPDSDLEAAGYRFIDFCEDLFSMHFQETTSGRLIPLTNAAAYTMEKLDLNRPHLIRVRALLRELSSRHRDTGINWDQPSKEQIARLLTVNT